MKISIIKKLIFICFFSVLLVIFLLIGELILAFAWHLTHNSKFGTLVIEEYPINPEKYVKIAVFGESSAAGYNSEKGFSDILSYELRKRYPNLKFYIKNYAEGGYPFHRHQAEIVKAVIAKYDFLLIYAGHNELHNYLDDIGYFRPVKYKDRRTLMPFIPPDKKSSLVRYLESKSRIYAVIKKGYNFIKSRIANIRKEEGGNAYCPQVHEFASQKALPEDEILKISSNFKKDLEDIAKLASDYKKSVIISSVPVNGIWKPFFSVFKPGLTQKEKEVFYEKYAQGMDFYKRKEFKKAIPYFLKAEEIDGKVAILNYLLGYSYLMLNNTAKGRQFLIRSCDEDGYPIRALSQLREIEKEASRKYRNLYFVDSIEIFQRLLDKGIHYSDLFSDLQHPSLLGHIIIANNFLFKLQELAPFKSQSFEANYLDLKTVDLNTLAANYKKELNISEKEESWNALMISRWYVGMTGFSAYPENFLNAAEEYTNKFYEKSVKKPNDLAIKLLFLALIESDRKNGDLQKSISLANQSREVSPLYVDNFLKSKALGWGELIRDRLKKNGIVYSGNRFFGYRHDSKE